MDIHTMQALSQQLSISTLHPTPYLCSTNSSARSSTTCSFVSSAPPQTLSISRRSNVGSKQVNSLSRSVPFDQNVSFRPKNVIRAATGESATTSAVKPPSVGVQNPDDRVKHVTTVEEFDEALRTAKNKLVVVEYAATHSANSRRIYPSMVDLSKNLKGVVFLLVLGDESDATKELCERAGVRKVPHFVFYKHSVKIHEEQGITSDVLEGDVLYYGDNDAPIHEVKNKEDFEVLLKGHASDHQLVVLDVGLKSCGPCAKIYPTFVSLSKRMVGNTVFARMHGDENEECSTLLKSMGVVEVPTFLFIRDGKPLGRYVGSGRGELVGEILRYNGVRVT
ncbi:unnamed protein product [Calypogeia fissa]